MTTPPQRSYAKTAQRRATLARAALEIVEESGHSSLTTADVARRAGASDRTLFYHFPTRDHLLVAALDLADEDSEAEAAIRFQASEISQAPDARFEDLVGLLSHRNADRPWVVRLTGYLSAHAQDPAHPAHDYFKRHYLRTTGQFTELVRLMQSSGRAHPDLEPERVARRLIAVWEGLQDQWLVSQDFDLTAEIQDSFWQLTGGNVMQVRQAIDDAMDRQVISPRSA